MSVGAPYRDAPSLKPEPTQPWWEVVEYTAADGRTHRSRSLTNAIIALYGTVVMQGHISHTRSELGGYRAVTPIYDLRAFRRDGSMEHVGSVSWPIDSEAFVRSRRMR
jgi:hypothetical protein